MMENRRTILEEIERRVEQLDRIEGMVESLWRNVGVLRNQETIVEREDDVVKTAIGDLCDDMPIKEVLYECTHQMVRSECQASSGVIHATMCSMIDMLRDRLSVNLKKGGTVDSEN